MYFSVGGHPAFMIPEQYDIVFNKGLENHTETELEYVLIDPETAGVDVAHPRKLKLQDGRIPYTRTLFDEDALIFDNTQVERVGVEVDGNRTSLSPAKASRASAYGPSQKQMPRSCASSHGSAAATTSALTAN